MSRIRKIFLAGLLCGIPATSVPMQVPTSIPGAVRYSWVGNSFGGGGGCFGSGSALKHVGNNSGGLFVDKAGFAFVPADYGDEGGCSDGVYKDGNLVAAAFNVNPRNNATVADEQYMYVGGRFEPAGWQYLGSGIHVYHKGDFGGTWSWPGSGIPNGVGTQNAWWFIDSVENAITGLGINTTAGELYVADSVKRKLFVYSTVNTSQTPVRSWNLAAHAGAVAVDKNGVVWVIIRGTPNTIVGYSAAGSLQKTITLAAGVVARGLAFTTDNRMLIADDGPDQQIKIYKNLAGTPAPDGTFGQSIMTGATPGLFGDRRFYGVVGVGCDSLDNIYIACGGRAGSGTIVHSYKLATGQANWKVFGMQYVDLAKFDPTSENDLYTRLAHYKLDFTKTAPGSEWSLYSLNYDQVRFPVKPDDDRLNSGVPTIRTINGQRILYVEGMAQGGIRIYRFEPNSEIAVPAAEYQGNSIKKFWKDTNGNGLKDAGEEVASDIDDQTFGGSLKVMDNGDIYWVIGTSIMVYKLHSFLANGVPDYRPMSEQSWPAPVPFNSLERADYNPSTNVMYLSGYTPELSTGGCEFKNAGRVVARYDNWSTGNRSARYAITLPFKKDSVCGSFGGGSIQAKCLAIAGDYVFVHYGLRFHTRIFNALTGDSVGIISPYGRSEYGPDLNGGWPMEGIWVDVATGLDVKKRSNGEYDIMVEDDIYAKSVMYRWCPSGNCPEGSSANQPSIISSNQDRSGLYIRAISKGISIGFSSRGDYILTICTASGREIVRYAGRSTGSVSLKASLIPGVYYMILSTTDGHTIRRPIFCQ